jgi:hypothetical protein
MSESNKTSRCVKAIKLCHEWQSFIAFTHHEVLLLSLTTKIYCFYTPWSFITFTHDKVLLFLHTVKFYYFHSRRIFIVFTLKQPCSSNYKQYLWFSADQVGADRRISLSKLHEVAYWCTRLRKKEHIIKPSNKT